MKTKILKRAFLSLLTTLLILFAGSCSSTKKKLGKYDRPEQFGNRGKPQPLPFYLYKDFGARGTIHYIPSGYMGDQMAITLVGYCKEQPYSGKSCIKIVYNTSDPTKTRAGWSGIYWLTPPNNWGLVKGAGYNLENASELVIYARGTTGKEKINLKVGGVTGRYPDSDVSDTVTTTLSTSWKKYTISLSGMDRKHIIGGLCITIERAANEDGATFFIDEIYFTN